MIGYGREPYDDDFVELGGNNTLGHIVSLSGKASRRRKRPIGFAAPARRSRRKQLSAGREAGTFPEVPRFDVR